MKRDECDYLDYILSAWHHHCMGYKLSAQAACPMFREALRAKGEQTIEAIAEDQHWAGVFKAMDFHVGEMKDPYRSAIYILARNCYTGRSVWISPRLPKDPIARGEIIRVARVQLTKKLMWAGVI